MDILGWILAVTLSGLVVGALGRLAVPGRDPMSIWRTIGLGILGSLVGGAIAGALGVASAAGLLLSAVVSAALLLILYRRVVERRGITGPGARRP